MKTRSIFKTARQYLRQFGALVSIKRFVWTTVVNKVFNDDRRRTRLNLVQSFPLFSPFSEGNYTDKAKLTIQSINQTIPLMGALACSTGSTPLKIIGVRSFPDSEDALAAAMALKTSLDKFGSDKANRHDYHFLYGPILQKASSITSLLEIGMGTDNTDVVSNMGHQGRPGASLRAFRDFLPNAKIFGADVDRRILFNEIRIETFYVDQTDPKTFAELESNLPHSFDLIIDDGLHSPNANLITLEFALRKVKIEGWVVIEDISPDAVAVWEVVSAILAPDQFQCHLFRADAGMLFAVKRLK